MAIQVGPNLFQQNTPFPRGLVDLRAILSGQDPTAARAFLQSQALPTSTQGAIPGATRASVGRQLTGQQGLFDAADYGAAAGRGMADGEAHAQAKISKAIADRTPNWRFWEPPKGSSVRLPWTTEAVRVPPPGALDVAVEAPRALGPGPLGIGPGTPGTAYGPGIPMGGSGPSGVPGAEVRALNPGPSGIPGAGEAPPRPGWVSGGASSVADDIASATSAGGKVDADALASKLKFSARLREAMGAAGRGEAEGALRFLNNSSIASRLGSGATGEAGITRLLGGFGTTGVTGTLGTALAAGGAGLTAGQLTNAAENHFGLTGNNDGSGDNALKNALAWGAAGAAAGSVLPGVGTLVGGAVGGLGGALVGGALGAFGHKDTGEKAVEHAVESVSKDLSSQMVLSGVDDATRAQVLAQVAGAASGYNSASGFKKAMKEQFTGDKISQLSQLTQIADIQRQQERQRAAEQAAINAWAGPLMSKSIDQSNFFAQDLADKYDDLANLSSPRQAANLRAMGAMQQLSTASMGQAQLAQLQSLPTLLAYQQQLADQNAQLQALGASGQTADPYSSMLTGMASNYPVQ